jgi:ATP sulfurylase
LDFFGKSNKLFAFYSPIDFFILDARVAYVINKLIITNALNNHLPINFIINRSRNASLTTNYRVLMNTWNGQLINIIDYYPLYSSLIKEIHSYFINQNPLIFRNNVFINDDPEIIEMLLFYLADYI